MEKLDLKTQWKHLYLPTAKKVQLVDVPEFRFIMIDGKIEPGHSPDSSPDFSNAMQALYGAAFTLKFLSKLRPVDPIDYPVMALEGLWWVEDGEFDINKKDNWRFTMMMMQPDHISEAMFEEALHQLRTKRDSPAIDRLRLERFCEGLSVQVLHKGPYADEPATIERIKAFAAENGYVAHGKHHEIYLGDPRRAEPEKLRTVLRHGVERKVDWQVGKLADK